MPTTITWEDPCRGEGNPCFRLGTDPDGVLLGIKAGEADHLL